MRKMNQPATFYIIWLCPFGSWYRIRSSWSNGSQYTGLSVTSDMHDFPWNADLVQSHSHCHLHELRKERIRPLILGLKLRMHRKTPLRQICSHGWEIRFKSVKGQDNLSSKQKLLGWGIESSGIPKEKTCASWCSKLEMATNSLTLFSMQRWGLYLLLLIWVDFFFFPWLVKHSGSNPVLFCNLKRLLASNFCLFKYFL